MLPRTDVGCPRHRQSPGSLPAPVRVPVALAIAGFCFGCASTHSPREFMNRRRCGCRFSRRFPDSEAARLATESLSRLQEEG